MELKKLALADFGISSVMKNSSNLNTRKNVTGVNGNLDYMAQEELNWQKYYYIKTDAHSFGKLINHLFLNPNCIMKESNKTAK
jgi:hypothetical protein